MTKEEITRRVLNEVYGDGPSHANPEALASLLADLHGASSAFRRTGRTKGQIGGMPNQAEVVEIGDSRAGLVPVQMASREMGPVWVEENDVNWDQLSMPKNLPIAEGEIKRTVGRPRKPENELAGFGGAR